MSGPTWCDACKRYRSLSCWRCLERARGRMAARFGWLYFAAFLALGFTASAHADTWHIHCGEHLSAAHHLGTYIAYWQLETTYTTEQACGDGADVWLAHNYHGGVLPDGSRVLVQCWCERVRP